jgi:hypothetical protein
MQVRQSRSQSVTAGDELSTDNEAHVDLICFSFLVVIGPGVWLG